MNDGCREDTHEQAEEASISLVIMVVHALQKGGAMNAGDQCVDLYSVTISPLFGHLHSQSIGRSRKLPCRAAGHLHMAAADDCLKLRIRRVRQVVALLQRDPTFETGIDRSESAVHRLRTRLLHMAIHCRCEGLY